MVDNGVFKFLCTEESLTAYRRELKESKEDILSGALKENVIEEKEEFTKRKIDARKKTWYTGKLQGQFVEGIKDIADKLLGKWIKINYGFF